MSPVKVEIWSKDKDILVVNGAPEKSHNEHLHPAGFQQVYAQLQRQPTVTCQHTFGTATGEWDSQQSYSPYLWQIIQAKLVGKHAACHQVCDLQGQCCPVPVFAFHQVAHFIMDTDAEAPLDGELLQQPTHAHQYQVEVVHRWALHHPVDAAGQELQKIQHVRALVNILIVA